MKETVSIFIPVTEFRHRTAPHRVNRSRCCRKIRSIYSFQNSREPDWKSLRVAIARSLRLNGARGIGALHMQDAESALLERILGNSDSGQRREEMPLLSQ